MRLQLPDGHRGAVPRAAVVCTCVCSLCGVLLPVQKLSLFGQGHMCGKWGRKPQVFLGLGVALGNPGCLQENPKRCWVRELCGYGALLNGRRSLLVNQQCWDKTPAGNVGPVLTSCSADLGKWHG